MSEILIGTIVAVNFMMVALNVYLVIKDRVFYKNMKRHNKQVIDSMRFLSEQAWLFNNTARGSLADARANGLESLYNKAVADLTTELSRACELHAKGNGKGEE